MPTGFRCLIIVTSCNCCDVLPQRTCSAGPGFVDCYWPPPGKFSPGQVRAATATLWWLATVTQRWRLIWTGHMLLRQNTVLTITYTVHTDWSSLISIVSAVLHSSDRSQPTISPTVHETIQSQPETLVVQQFITNTHAFFSLVKRQTLRQFTGIVKSFFHTTWAYWTALMSIFSL